MTVPRSRRTDGMKVHLFHFRALILVIVVFTVFTVVTVIVSAHEAQARNKERTERIAQVNALACDLSSWFQTVGKVLAVRDLPGDPTIIAATKDVIVAAEVVGGPCLPKERP